MLEAFFKPKSIAIIGASRSEDKLGYAVLANLIESGFGGDIYPVNPSADFILERQVYPDIPSLPQPPDLAVIVIPYPYVPDAVRECGEKGVKAVIVISAGFRETGREGLELEMELLDIVREYGMRLIGPNCLGVIDAQFPHNVTFAAGGMPPKGPVAFMSQSGALGTAVLDISFAGQHVGFSKFVSLGNKGDVNEIDLIDYLADDPHTRVILSYTEGLTDGRAFINIAQTVSRHKPIIILKSGVTQSGQRAVSSHTGSLAGAEQAYEAGFRQAGVIRAQTMQALFDYALAFGYQPLLDGNRIAIVTNAGGPGILATDALERRDLQLARLQNETIISLEERLPDAASAANPVDVLGDARADRYRFALELVASDPNVDGVLVILTPQAMTEIEATAQALGEIAQDLDKPVLACFMGEKRIRAGVDVLYQHHVPNYPDPERAALSFAAMRDYAEVKARETREIPHIEGDRAAVQQIIETVRGEDRVSIGEAEGRQILAAYGFKLPASQMATDPDEAVRLADEIGYPVVLKIASPDILHKTDIGGVKVGLETPQEVRDAFELMIYRARRYLPDAQVDGALVQKQAPSGLEVLVGMNRDPQFGPLVTFGLGGIYVEVLRDVAFRIAPFSREDAYELLEEIRARSLLDGVRGEPPADKDALADALLRISQLVTDFPDIVELDINPLIVYEEGRGVLALDARMILD